MTPAPLPSVRSDPRRAALRLDVAGRYRLGKEVGAGAQGRVFAALDKVSGKRVALKLVPRSEGGIGDEFLLARAVRHPYVARIYDIGRADDAHDFFTMELIDGGELRTVLSAHGITGVARALTCCAMALDHVHARGIVHADLKPSNILVTQGRSGVETRVIDFGLSRPTGGTAGGTPAYMAPELFCGAAPSASTDLFALGVSVAEALSGHNPFDAATVAEITLRHREAEIDLPESVPAPLAQVVRRLVSRNPEVRYRSAQKLLHALTDALPDVVEPLVADAQPFVPGAAPLVARASVLAQLLDAMPPRCFDGTGVVLLWGALAAGRTRLLDELAVRLRLDGIDVVVGTGSARSNAAFVRLVDDADALDEAAILALAHEIDRLTSPQHGLVVVSRLPTARLLDRLGARGPVRTIRVASLTDAAFGRLVSSTLGEIDDGDGHLVEVLHRASHGLPGRFETVLSAQIERGAIQWREGRWTIDPRVGLVDPETLLPDDAAVDDGAALVVDAFDDKARAILLRGALLGDSFTRDGLAALELFALDRHFDALVYGGALDRDGDVLSFVDPAVRVAARDRLSRAERRQLHGRAAEWLAYERPEAHAERARHLSAAGDDRAGREAMRLAAEGAFEIGRTGAVAGAWRWILRHGGEPGLCHVRAGDAEARAGRYAVAQHHYELAIAAGRDGAFERRQHAWMLVELGRSAEARPLLEAALEVALGQANLDEVVATHFAVGWAAMMNGDYDRASEAAAAGLALVGDAETAAAARMWRLVGTMDWHRGDPEASADAFRRGAAAATAAGDKEAIAECRMGLGTALRLQGELDGAAAEYTEAERLDRTLGRPGQRAKCLNNLGVVHYLAGRWGDAETAWAQFRDICVHTGHRPDLVMAHNNLGFLYKDRGELDRSESELRRGRAVAEAAGFTRGIAMVRGNLGEVLTLQRKFDEAQAELDAAYALAVAIDSRDEALEARRRRAGLAVARGDADAALAEIEVALPEAETTGNAGEEAHLLCLRGEVHRLRGDLEPALADLSTARLKAAKAGSALDAASMSLAWARAELERPADDVAECIRTARATAARLGAERVLRDADALDVSVRQRRWSSSGGLTRLLDLTRELALELDLDRLLERVADAALDITGAQRGLVILYEAGDAVRVHTARWSEDEQREEMSLRISRTIADRVHRQGRSVVVADAFTEHDLRNRDSIRDLGLRAILCVPLRVRGESVGILYVDSRRPRQVFDERDLAVLEALAQHAAVAVQNAALFQRERRRSEFVALMAHDFRAPLAALSNTFELLFEEDAVPDRELREMMSTALDQIERLDQLSDEIVDLDRLEQGSMRIQPTPADAFDLLALSAHYVEPMARREGVRFTANIADDLPAVEADPVRVHQILKHLVTHALRAVDRGGRVELRAQVVDASGPERAADADRALGWSPQSRSSRRWVRIDVRDNGLRLPDAFVRTIVEKGDVSTDEREHRVHRGRGLGVAIARALVQQHGGQMWLESTADCGNAIIFTLPASE